MRFSENFVHNETKISYFNIINADENNPIFCHQLLQQFQARIHHAKPLVVTAQILALCADNLPQPCLDMRIVDIVVVHPFFVARVIRRINIDALHPSLVHRQQRFERIQIIAVDNHVAVAVPAVRRKGVLLFQRAERHIEMMIDDFIFSDPVKGWHGWCPPELLL